MLNMSSITSDNLYIDLLKSEDLTIEEKYIQDLQGACENFCSFFTKKIQIKIEELSKKHENQFENLNSFIEYSFKYVYKTILDASIKTLIKEINVYKNKKGSTIDIYEEFSHKLLKLSFHKQLYEKYPILYELIDKKIENYFLLIECFLNSLENDLEELQHTFRFENQKIMNVYLSGGDFHNGGKTTIFFTIGKTKIVYKPKNLENDLLLHDIVDLLNKFPEQKCKLKHVNTINRGDYGWQIVVDQQKCTNIEEVDNYYYRIGSFLSVFLLLGTDDLHNENIISCGEYPYFIDLETLVKTEQGTSIFSGVMKTFFDEINHSVLSTMLLPTNAIYSAMDCDIGGISSFNEEATTRMKAFQLIKKGTDKIALEQREVFMGSGDNHLYLNDNVVYPNNFSEEIVNGFKDTFHILIKNMDAVKSIINSRTIFSRCVVRPTFVYGSFLDASLHPNYLQDIKKRNKLFAHLYTTKEANNTMLVSQEVEALMNGDIPYFHQVGRNLICNQGTVIPYYFAHPLEETISNRIEIMKRANLDRQISYIRLSLSTLKNRTSIEKVNMFKELSFTSRARELVQFNNESIIKELESKMFNKLLWDADHKSCTWISATQLEKQYSLNCANASIYESGGVLMFYLMLYKQTSDEKYLLYAESIFRGLEEMGILKQKLNESAFIGISSHLYLAANLYQLTKKAEYKNFVINCLHQLEEIEFSNLDYLNGVSGLLVLLNNLQKKIPLNETLSLTNKAIRYMDKHIDQFQPETGVAHGYSGIVLGLLAAAELLNNKDYVKRAAEIILLENKYFKREEKNWLDLRDMKSINYGWCRGSSGIAVVRAKFNQVAEQSSNLDFVYALETTINAIQTNGFKDDSLCHGVFGAIDNLIEINKISNYSYIENDVQSFMNKKLEETISKGFRYGVPDLIEAENLFVGYIGLGYLMLRVANEELPSILHLELFN